MLHFNQIQTILNDYILLEMPSSLILQLIYDVLYRRQPSDTVLQLLQVVTHIREVCGHWWPASTGGQRRKGAPVCLRLLHFPLLPATSSSFSFYSPSSGQTWSAASSISALLFSGVTLNFPLHNMESIYDLSHLQSLLCQSLSYLQRTPLPSRYIWSTVDISQTTFKYSDFW